MNFSGPNIGQKIMDMAKIQPDAVAVEWEGQTYTRSDVLAAAANLGVFFQQKDIKPTQTVAVISANPLRGIEAMIALWSQGSPTLFLDPRQPLNDICASLKRAEIDMAFSDIKSLSRSELVHSLPDRNSCFAAAKPLDFSKAPSDGDALVLSTSGTTNLPRFRRVTHKAFLDGVARSEHILNQPAPLPAVIVGSLAFGAILMHWIRMMIHGKFILALPLFFRTKELHEALSRTDIAAVGLPPVLIRDLLLLHEGRGVQKRGPAYPHIERMASVGGPITSSDLVKAYKTLTPGFSNLYSLAGVGPVSRLARDEILHRPNSVGKPLANTQVDIRTSSGKQCKPGNIGNIVVTPLGKDKPAPMETGDIGWLDEDGYLFIAGRSQQLASRHSVNISLLELENDVKALAGVRDCIAFTTVDPKSADDVVFLAVETALNLSELSQAIRKSVASYRRPDKIMVKEMLPRNASNKIALGTLQTTALQKESTFDEFR